MSVTLDKVSTDAPAYIRLCEFDLRLLDPKLSYNRQYIDAGKGVFMPYLREYEAERLFKKRPAWEIGASHPHISAIIFYADNMMIAQQFLARDSKRIVTSAGAYPGARHYALIRT